MRTLCVLFFAIVFNAVFSAAAFARKCEGEPIRNAQINDTIETKYKIKINEVCQRSMRRGTDQFLGIEFVQYPKGVMQILSKDYEFAFSFNKIGSYVVKYRVHLRDRYGKEGYITYVMNVEAVSQKWN